MEKEDLSLPVEMGKLEIEPAKYVVPINGTNPFVPLSQYKSFIQRNSKTCSCGVLSKVRKNTLTRKKKNKVLKEPVLKLLQSKLRVVHTNTEHVLADKLCRCNCSDDNLESLNLSALVYDCNKLKISSDNQSKCIEGESAWCRKVPPYTVHSVVTDRNVASPSCSQQALNPPCDITIDELASYFETMVHIPKKMSSMAEMMYI